MRNALRKRRKGARPPNVAIVRALIAMGETAARENGGTFAIAGYKLKKVPRSRKWYVGKYDPSLRYDPKTSLGTEDEQQAKTMIALMVAEEDGADPFHDQEDLSLEAAVELYLQSSKKRNDSWASTSGSTLRGLERTLPDITVGTFYKGRQKELIAGLHAGVAGRPMQVGSISNCLILIKAAIAFVCDPDDKGDRRCLAVKLPCLYSKSHVAEVLDVPEPEPRNWHATIEETAAFLRLIADDEKLRRWMFMMLAYVCRAEAAAQATSEQMDLRKGVYHLNPKRRRQQPTKFRPSLPIPPSVLAEMACWGDGVWIGEDVPALRARFIAAGDRLGLGEHFVPSSVRDFGATMLRDAYVRYGCPLVVEQQHKMWMGHREKSINHLYGKFSPDYLLLARNAVECVMHELDRLSGGVLFRNARAAGTLPPGPVVIDPFELRGSGLRARSANSGKPNAANDDGEGDKITERPILPKGETEKKAWGKAVVIGPNRAKMGGVGSLQGRFCQVQARPDWMNERPDGVAARLIAQGYKIVEFWREGDEGGSPQLFIIGKSAKLLSDEETRKVCNSSWIQDVKGRRVYEAGAKAPTGQPVEDEASKVPPVMKVACSQPLIRSRLVSAEASTAKQRNKYDPR